MLREDGHVMDDGTATARLAENHYVMTTTAAAGQVMRHLDFVHQCMHPEWDVSFISVTEQWAQFSIAGPKSQELVNAVYWINQLLQKLSHSCLVRLLVF